MEVPVTVLMPVYNGSKYIAEAINSVLEQTFTDFELIIVNDGSTDGTVSVVQNFKDPRIKLISQQNGGVSSALNNGLKISKGKYIARFDADDVCYPTRLQKQYDFITANPEYILVGSDADYMTESGEHIYTYRNVGHTNEEINQTIKMHCSFIHSSVMYPKELVTSIGGYEIKAHTFEDYFLWTKLIKFGKICNLPEPLIKVRFNPSSVTIDEKDHDPKFLFLKRKALETGQISDIEGEEIYASLQRVSKKKKESSYHRLLGKKFLWDNYHPAKARKHLFKSAILEPVNFSTYLLVFFSLLPQKMIQFIYKRTKA